MSDFRFKRLERYRVGGTGDKMELSIPIPKTSSGKEYRLCPISECIPRLFLFGDAPAERKISEENIERVRRQPGTPGTTCPYCGNDAPDRDFIHPEDIEAAKEYIKWAASQDIGEYIEDLAKDFNQKMKKVGQSLFSVEIDVKHAKLSRPYVWREDLLRNLACDVCGREYGVYAVALYCPDCGSPNVHVHIQREMELIKQQISMAEKIASDGDKELAYRLLGNAHEDVLTVFETYLKTIYRFLVKGQLPSEKAKKLVTKQAIGNRFQNIERGRELFNNIGVDPFDCLSSDNLDILRLNIEKRHVVGHNLSVADEAYVAVTQSEQPGRTVNLLANEINQFAEISLSIVLRLEKLLRQ